MLVSGSLAKIVDSGLLSKVCRSFVSDKGREGGAGEGGAERRAPPLELELWFSNGLSTRRHSQSYVVH